MTYTLVLLNYVYLLDIFCENIFSDSSINEEMYIKLIFTIFHAQKIALEKGFQ